MKGRKVNEFLARSLGALNAILSVIVISISGIVGFYIGENQILDYGGFIGVAIGLVVGWIVAVIVFGTLAVLLNIRELLVNVRDSIEKQQIERRIRGRSEPRL